MTKRYLRVWAVLGLLVLLSLPTAARADTIQWEGVNWDHWYGSPGPYVDANNNLVLTNGYHYLNNGTVAWGNWFEVSFIDPGINLGGFYMEIFDGPHDMLAPRAWIGGYWNDLNVYNMGAANIGDGYAGLYVPRAPGAHTFRIENYASNLVFWIDGQRFDTLLHWDYLINQFTYETLVGPLASVQTVELWGNNVILTDFRYGTSEPSNTVPEPGSMLLFGSAAGLLGWWRRRQARKSAAPAA
ncbi:MAG: PEP-CTERM sorting domain-containing protein [Desulfarculus sp.]|nr:PEP-CTERM sorting domain-containing protein [Desulfarculus sp.]